MSLRIGSRRGQLAIQEPIQPASDRRVAGENLASVLVQADMRFRNGTGSSCASSSRGGAHPRPSATSRTFRLRYTSPIPPASVQSPVLPIWAGTSTTDTIRPRAIFYRYRGSVLNLDVVRSSIENYGKAANATRPHGSGEPSDRRCESCKDQHHVLGSVHRAPCRSVGIHVPWGWICSQLRRERHGTR
jgi:hypothetical protein